MHLLMDIEKASIFTLLCYEQNQMLMHNEHQRIKKQLDQLTKHNENLEKNMQVLIRNTESNNTNKVLGGWVFIEEIINLLGVSRSSVYRFIEDGLLPFSKFGSRLIFKIDDILEIINRNYK